MYINKRSIKLTRDISYIVNKIRNKTTSQQNVCACAGMGECDERHLC